ncbi:hypothetical protein [Nevskia soli]|uniref:hypothetical protein n=1 Tax=Nevskia soli TaxID=418856 RepID=UPI0004A70C8A|nr:hypothetical protein [Nevskia soli]
MKKIENLDSKLAIDEVFQNYSDVFSKTLHIYHKEWWGIKSATLVLPGHKLEIPANSPVDIRIADKILATRGIRYVFFQGYSHNAADLAEHISAFLGASVKMAVVTHVSVAQFDNQFEIDMLSLMMNQKKRGILKALFSVKPNFHTTCEAVEPLLLVNALPAWAVELPDVRTVDAAFIPLARGLRKNLHANHIALCRSSYSTVFSSQHGGDLLDIIDHKKVQYLGFIPPSHIRQIMGRVGLVLNVTLIECQPMTFNEAVSVGTPCLTGPLFLPFMAKHPLRELTEILEPDNVELIRVHAERIKQLWWHDHDGVVDMCRDYHEQVQRASAESYLLAVSRLD